MENSTVIDNLGRLAARSEIMAANPRLYPSERAFEIALADRYREAQFVEMRKAMGNES